MFEIWEIDYFKMRDFPKSTYWKCLKTEWQWHLDINQTRTSLTRHTNFQIPKTPRLRKSYPLSAPPNFQIIMLRFIPHPHQPNQPAQNTHIILNTITCITSFHLSRLLSQSQTDKIWPVSLSSNSACEWVSKGSIRKTDGFKDNIPIYPDQDSKTKGTIVLPLPLDDD